MEMIKILIQAGGDINSQNEDGFTPLHVASMKGLVKAINSLIQAGADVNCQNRIGSTALHVASRYHRVEVIWALLAAGADATIKDNRGYCAYDIAYENRCRGWWMVGCATISMIVPSPGEKGNIKFQMKIGAQPTSQKRKLQH